jgi:multiple sugar transport system ATP-binding protein
VEYLGTTQIVTLATPHGDIKARISSSDPAPRPGDAVGLEFLAPTVTLFDQKTGRALRSALHGGH